MIMLKRIAVPLMNPQIDRTRSTNAMRNAHKKPMRERVGRCTPTMRVECLQDCAVTSNVRMARSRTFSQVLYGRDVRPVRVDR
jgi:hypothetical protein